LRQGIEELEMADKMTLNYCRVEDFECNEVPDGYVIYDHAREEVHFLNLTAAAVFELCDGKRDSQTITALVQNAYELAVPPTADVEACLESLLSQGLITPREATRAM
jgi:Coenzyme PQQ synthesis protein D (PqqD)